jgi:hypothetical protein
MKYLHRNDEANNSMILRTKKFWSLFRLNKSMKGNKTWCIYRLPLLLLLLLPVELSDVAEINIKNG